MKSELETSKTLISESSQRRQWLLGLSVVFLFFVFIVYYVSVHWVEFCSLWHFSYRETTLTGFFLFIGFLLNCYQINLFLNKFGVRLGLFELIFATHGMMLGNMVIPMRGGSGGLAIYLKKAHQLNYGKFAVIYGGTAILVGLVNAVMGLIALSFLAINHQIFEPTLTAVTILLLIACIYLTLFPPRLKKSGSSGIINLLGRLNESWVSLSQDFSLMIKVTVSLIIITLTQTLALCFIYSAISRPLSFSATLITSSLGAVANLIPITPGSLGVFDTVIIEVPRLFGLDMAAAIVATALFRILSFAICFVIGLPGLYCFFNVTRSRKP